jgi:hypothetical protein
MGAEAQPRASHVALLEGVRVSLGGRAIQDNMTFTIEDGEFIAPTVPAKAPC